MIAVIMNEQHNLLPEQEKKLNELGEEWEIYPVPHKGWKVVRMEGVVRDLEGNYSGVIFVSPVPYLLMRMAERYNIAVSVFHNDRREKKEIDGRVIYTVSKTGWEIC